MIPVRRLMEILRELPEDALPYAYEGEFVGIIFVSADDKELGTYQQRKQVQTIWSL